MFETASNWEVINNYTEVTYPSGRMRVRNSTSGSRTIGVKKDFITGTGEHTVSFDVTLPIFSCIGGIVMGASSTDSLGSGFNASDTIAGVENYQTLSYPSDFYAVVEIRDENNSIVLKDSTNITATHSYTFSAPQGKEYNISLYSNRFCPSSSFHIDNVFISYDTLEVVTGNTIIVSDTLFIINNDFENPIIEPNGAGVKIDGWTHYSPSTTLSVEPHNGSDWLKVVSTNGTHGAHQAFAVEPGESYTFEIDLHRPAGMNKEINVVIWKNTGPSGAYTLHVLNTDGSNTFNYTATSSNIYIQIRQAGTYYLDNIRMYRTYEDTMFVSGYKMDMAYRYGYMSAERDDELKGSGNSLNFTLRMYDPRLGRFLAPDPYESDYPSFSTYSFVGNNPIMNVEVDGGWWFSKSESNTYKVRGPHKDKFPRDSEYAYKMSNVRAVSAKQNSFASYIPFIGNLLNASALAQKAEDPTMKIDAGDIASIALGAYFKGTRKVIKASGALVGARKTALRVSEEFTTLVTNIATSPDLKESWVELAVMQHFANQQSEGGNKIGQLYGDDEGSYTTTFRFNQSFISELEENFGKEFDNLKDKSGLKREDYINSKVEGHLKGMFEDKKSEIMKELDK